MDACCHVDDIISTPSSPEIKEEFERFKGKLEDYDAKRVQLEGVNWEEYKQAKKGLDGVYRMAQDMYGSNCWKYHDARMGCAEQFREFLV